MSVATFCATINSFDGAAEAQLNGTSPWTVISPGWAPQPAGRGTMDIVWSCLVTIFACSWTVTHPDLRGTAGERFTSSKVWLCGIAVIAPEVLAFIAFTEYLMVRCHFQIINKMNKGQWNMSQIFFVSMGGMSLEFEDSTETLEWNSDGDFFDDKALGIFQRALQLDLLDSNSILAEDIEKRAKTIYVVKALVCLQVSWLVAQVIGRAVAKLPITTLEVVTMGYVVCALITYFCWWHKPQDAEVPITISCKSLTRANFHQQIEALRCYPYVERWGDLTLLCVITGVFGAVHCTAWNFFFATSAESIIWRIASVLTVILPIGFGSLLGLDMDKVGWPLIFIYAPIRLYLMIEPFVAFRSVPVGIFYTVNWSTWIPHI